MSDDKTNSGARDRATVSSTEDYEVEDFARAHNITPARTRELIKEHGGNRGKMEAALSKKLGS